MQPIDPARRVPAGPSHPFPPFAPAGAARGARAGRDAPLPSAPLCLDAPALLVEARFRDVPLTSRLLRADLPGAFTIGAARGSDAPVNPAWLGAPAAALDTPAHRFVERTDAGFVVNLTPAMRAELRTSVQRLAIPPDHGHAEAPLALPIGATLLVPCGEVTFELHATEPAAAVPRPWLPPRWREGLGYPLGVLAALGLLLVAALFVPADPRALSLDALGTAHRFDRFISVPLDVTAPSIETALGLRQAGGPGAPAAAQPSGSAGSRKAPDVDRRLAIRGPAAPTNAREAAARIRSNPMLALLGGARTGALADVMTDAPVLGADLADASGRLVATTIGDAWGAGGLGPTGTGTGASGEREGTIGGGGLGTMGRFHGGDGNGRDYGHGVGNLRRRTARVPDFIVGDPNVRGSLDKEIIRRIVRRHINEVRYCYDQALAAHPSLAGRVVVQFTIAPTGRVLAAVLSSTSLGAPAVERCVVDAVHRWEFPEPKGGGLVIVSYPFQFSPAGG